MSRTVYEDRDDCPVPSCPNTKLRTSQVCGACWGRLGNLAPHIMHDPEHTACGLSPALLKRAIECLEADKQ